MTRFPCWRLAAVLAAACALAAAAGPARAAASVRPAAAPRRRGSGATAVAADDTTHAGALTYRPTLPPDLRADHEGSVADSWLRAGSILAAGGLAAAWARDEEDPDAAVRQLDTPFLEQASDVGNVWGDGLVIGGTSLGIWGWGRLAGHARAAAVGGDLCESFLLSSAVCGTIKYAVNRRRPSGGGHSFPSGHTTVAFSVVPVLGHHFGWKASVPATLLAVATGVGRLEDRHHYRSDVVFGAAVGLACGSLVSGPGFLPGHARLAATPRSVGVAVPF